VPLRETTRPRTAEAIAAADLRDAIVRGDLVPGSKIRQDATARELGVSVIPVREALKTLAGEGLLDYRPQKGYFVAQLHAETIRDVYEARELVEARAERLAVKNVGPQDLQAMRTHLDRQVRAADEHDAVEMIAANRRFHFVLLKRCENPWILRFVTQLWDSTDPYRVLSYRRMWIEDDAAHVPAEILGEHEAILSALTAGTHRDALSLLKAHRDRSEVFLELLVKAVADAAAEASD
jgi:DNA-binding GntR family transcriptional regulator